MCLSPARVFGSAILGLVLVTVGPTTAQAQAEKPYDKILKSTVWIVVPHKERASGGRVPFSMGTGTLIDAQNKVVLTNYHVIDDAKDIICFFPAYKDKDKSIIPERKHYLDMINKGGGIPAKVLMQESKVDLALIQLSSVPEGSRIMPLARSGVTPGDQVHSVGNPGASDALWVYTPGRVRQTYQKKFKAGNDPSKLLDIDAKVVETDSPTNPGDSGGPLCNDRCELVGVTQGGARNAASISTFIDVSEVKTLLQKAKIRPVLASSTPTAPEKTTSDKKPATPTKIDPEQQAATKLKNAKRLVDTDREGAIEYCEEIIAKFADTKAAAEAKTLLEQLRKKK